MPARFVQDIVMDGALHVVTVRSQRASARLTGVSLPELPAGVIAIRSTDIPGRGTLVWGGGELPILASEVVRYVGEPVALVAAPELDVAQRVASETVLAYGEGVESDDTWLRGATGDTPDGDTEETAERQIVTSARRFAPPAPHEAIAWWEGQTLVVRTATRDPFHVRDTVAAVLDLPTGRVRILAERLDGPHGKHLMPSLVSAHAALVAASGRSPARVRYSWREEMGASFRIPATQGRWRTRGDRGELDLAFEGGARDPMAAEVVRRALQTVPGPYRAAALRLGVEYRFTGTVPCELPPGAGALEATVLRELWVSADARARGLDPATHRIALLGGGETEGEHHRRLRGHTAVSGRIEVIREVVSRSGFHRRWAACATAAERRGEDSTIPLRGIGIALATFAPGFEAAVERGRKLRLTLTRERRVVISTSAVDAGHGDRELLARLVGEILGLPADAVEHAPVDTQAVPDSGATAASRTVSILVPLVKRCAGLLKRRASRGKLPVSVECAAPTAAGGEPTGSAATVVAVEIDAETSVLRTTGVWVVIDAGEVLDPPRARAVACAAVLRGLSIATTEQSEAAMVPVPPASDLYAAPPPSYRIAGITELPPLDLSFLSHTDGRAAPPPSGISELALLGVPAAVAAAAEQALGRPVGRLPIEIEGRA